MNKLKRLIRNVLLCSLLIFWILYLAARGDMLFFYAPKVPFKMILFCSVVLGSILGVLWTCWQNLKEGEKK